MVAFLEAYIAGILTALVISIIVEMGHDKQ